MFYLNDFANFSSSFYVENDPTSPDGVRYVDGWMTRSGNKYPATKFTLDNPEGYDYSQQEDARRYVARNKSLGYAGAGSVVGGIVGGIAGRMTKKGLKRTLGVGAIGAGLGAIPGVAYGIANRRRPPEEFQIIDNRTRKPVGDSVWTYDD